MRKNLVYLYLPVASLAFHSSFVGRPSFHGGATSCCSSSSSSDTSTTSSPSSSTTLQPLPGVDDFEKWLSSEPVASWISLEHARFGTLRGLRWTNGDGKKKTPASKTLVASVPRAKVLSSDSTENWDVELACRLWKEACLGERSDYWGYIQLLTNGKGVLSGPMEPTAPDALRHWTSEQKTLLNKTESGKRLLALQQQQDAKWREMHRAVKDEISWEAFAWAMEVVHSRAFRGTKETNLASLAVPVVAAVAGKLYMTDNPDISPLVLGALAAVAAMPVVASLVTHQQSAVLLPLIDSANHLESADSSIDFDPLSRSFQLTIGPLCVDQDSQLFISYGSKSDAELLLNYGFLPSVSCNGNVSMYREKLALAFCDRNP